MSNPTLYSKNGTYPVEKEKLPDPFKNYTHEQMLEAGYEVKSWPPAINASQLLVWTGTNWLVVSNPDFVDVPEPNPWPLPVPPRDPSSVPVGNVISHGVSTYEWSGTEWIKIG